MKRIWGFDLGTASVGFAVVEHDEARGEGKIVKLGVRVFAEGVTEKTKEPRNFQRRNKRLARRQFRRRRRRKIELRKALVAAGLLPPSELKPRPRQSREDFFLNSAEHDPYLLRAKAVREKLELHEIGRVLFHLCKHRAFAGSRKFDSSKTVDREREREEKTAAQEITSHRKKMGDRSLGEYLHQEFKFPAAKRGHHFARRMVEDEFDRIWVVQSRFHPEALTGALKNRLRRIIFFQRPTFFRLNTIGECELQPGQRRCPKSDWHAQRFMMLQMLNSLRLSGDRPLGLQQREIILKGVEAKAKVSFQRLRKALGLEKEVFNFELGGKKDLLGNATEQELARIFGDGWAELPARERIRDEIADKLWNVEYRMIGKKRAEIRDADEIETERANLAREAQREWGVSAEQAQSLSKIDLPGGWARHSKRALQKMLPYLEAGMRYDEAKAKAYPDPPPANGSMTRLTAPVEVRNPTVMRTLHELRNVANNLLRAYGRPDVVRVELARDLKLPREKRLKLMSGQKDNEAKRNKALKALAERNIAGTGPNVEKWLLAEEQGWRCPYTGQSISWDGLFGNTGLFEVDHILPRSRSFDNSFGNKAVCHRDANKEKDKRTPYEAWGKDGNRWAEILKFLDDLERRNGFPRSKAARIKIQDYPAAGSEEFTNRQLVDSAYASRLAREYLATLGIRVEPANGRVTNMLGRLWGFHKILSPSAEKNRDDHRHHAIDALAVALTTPARIKAASEYFAAGKLDEDHLRRNPRKTFEPPWKDLHGEATRAVDEIIVSHRAQRKVSGALHDENPWGDTGHETKKHGTTYRFYAQRKQKTRVLERFQPSLMKAVGPEHSAFVSTNSNHHVAVYKDAAGALKFLVVSTFDAAMRIARQEPIVNRTPERGASFANSFCIGDMVARTVDGKRSYWVVRKISANGQITIQPHNLAQDIERTSPRITTLIKEGARKVVVDPIGRVFAAND